VFRPLVSVRSSPAEGRLASKASVRVAASWCPSDVLRTVSAAVLDFVRVDAGLAYPVSRIAADLAVELGAA
jgi:hypothetical protein